jgi:hypothetical protein
MLVMLKVEPPEFVITVESILLSPTATFPKLRLGGMNVTSAAGGKMVIVALFELVGPATEVAVTVTEALAGITTGAEYVTVAPLAEVLLERVPHAGEQDEWLCVRDHVTP